MPERRRRWCRWPPTWPASSARCGSSRPPSRRPSCSTCASRRSSRGRCCCTASRLLGIDWGDRDRRRRAPPARSRRPGSSSGGPSWRWRSSRPDCYGTTVASRGREPRSPSGPRRPTTWRPWLGWSAACLVADLPDAARRSVVAASSERTAKQHDVAGPARRRRAAGPDLRYGDVRGVDVGGVAGVLDAPWWSGPRSACRPRAARSTTTPPTRSAPASRAPTAAWPCSTTPSCASRWTAALVVGRRP